MPSGEDRSTSPSNLSEARSKLKDLIEEIEGVTEGGVQVGYPNDEILATLHHALGQIEDCTNTSSGSTKLSKVETEDTTPPPTNEREEEYESLSSLLSKPALFKALWDELTEEAYRRFSISTVVYIVSIKAMDTFGFDLEGRWDNWTDLARFWPQAVPLTCRESHTSGSSGRYCRSFGCTGSIRSAFAM